MRSNFDRTKNAFNPTKRTKRAKSTPTYSLEVSTATLSENNILDFAFLKK